MLAGRQKWAGGKGEKDSPKNDSKSLSHRAREPEMTKRIN